MTKAEQRALEAYNDMFHNPEKMSVRSTISPEELAESNFDYKEPFKAFFLDVYQRGYEAAEKDIIEMIWWRISEIVGDAQPKPILRAELEEMITKIKEQ